MVTVAELVITRAGNEVLLRSARGQLIACISLRDRLESGRAQLIPDTPEPADDTQTEPATIVLAELPEAELRQVRERAAHVREVLTGYRAGVRVCLQPLFIALLVQEVRQFRLDGPVADAGPGA